MSHGDAIILVLCAVFITGACYAIAYLDMRDTNSEKPGAK